MGSVRRKTATKLPAGATRFVTIAILGPLLVAAGCDNQDTARQALERGNSYYEQEDFESAIAAYTEAIRLKPDYAVAYNARGLAYEERGDKTKAEKDFAQAKKLGFEP